MSYCTLCECESEEIKHLPLYVIGSEGIDVCFNCQIILTKTAQSIMEIAARVKKNTIKKIKV